MYMKKERLQTYGNVHGKKNVNLTATDLTFGPRKVIGPFNPLERYKYLYKYRPEDTSQYINARGKGVSKRRQK